MSGVAQNSEARLVSTAGTFSGRLGPYRLQFWYHMFGEGIGSLVVIASDGDFEIRVFEQTGPSMCIGFAEG